MEAVIRAAVINDHEGLCKVYEELDELHRTNHPELFIKADGYARAKEYISGIIEDSRKALFVALIDSRVVGFAECYIQQASSFPVVKEREWIQLDNIAVLQAYQTHHIGSLLFAKVREWAKARQIGRIELKVYSFNKNAITFYSQKGFKDLSQTMYLDVQ